MDIRTYVNPVTMRSAASSRSVDQRMAANQRFGDKVELRFGQPSSPTLAGLTPAHLAQDARRVEQLHPVMQPRVQGFLHAARMAGYPVVVTPTGGYRSAEELAGNPDEAIHQTGLAVDYGFIEPNGKLRYDVSDDEAMEVARIANRFGLSWGSQPGLRAQAAPTHLQWSGMPTEADAQRVMEGRQEEIEGRSYPLLPAQASLEERSRKESFRALNRFSDDLAHGYRAPGNMVPPTQYLTLTPEDKRTLREALSEMLETTRIHEVMSLGLELARDPQGLQRFLNRHAPSLIPQAPASPSLPGAPLRMTALAEALATSKYGEELDLTA